VQTGLSVRYMHFHGLEAEDIDSLIADGYTLDDIEDIIYREHY